MDLHVPGSMSMDWRCPSASLEATSDDAAYCAGHLSVRAWDEARDVSLVVAVELGLDWSDRAAGESSPTSRCLAAIMAVRTDLGLSLFGGLGSGGCQ